MTLLIVIIVLALVFDYINGFHDAANSIATIVSTKVLTPFQAVVWAAFFNFVVLSPMMYYRLYYNEFLINRPLYPIFRNAQGIGEEQER